MIQRYRQVPDIYKWTRSYSLDHPDDVDKLYSVPGMEPSNSGDWVKWEDVRNIMLKADEDLLKHERRKYALELSYGIHNRKEPNE